MPTTTPMRASEVTGCLDRWFDDADARRLAAQTMTEALELLGSDSEAWALLALRSQYDGLQRLELLVGNVVSTSLRQDGASILYFLKQDEQVAADTAAALPGVTHELGPFEWPCLVVPEAQLAAVLDRAGEAHRRHLRSRTPKASAKRSIRAGSHSPAAIEELEQVLGRPVPAPAYA